MPRFFFDVTANGETDPDHEGVDLPNLHEARKEGGRCAGEMIQYASFTALPELWSMDIRDERGCVLSTLRFGAGEPEAIYSVPSRSPRP